MLFILGQRFHHRTKVARYNRRYSLLRYTVGSLYCIYIHTYNYTLCHGPMMFLFRGKITSAECSKHLGDFVAK